MVKTKTGNSNSNSDRTRGKTDVMATTSQVSFFTLKNIASIFLEIYMAQALEQIKNSLQSSLVDYEDST